MPWRAKMSQWDSTYFFFVVVDVSVLDLDLASLGIDIFFTNGYLLWFSGYDYSRKGEKK